MFRTNPQLLLSLCRVDRLVGRLTHPYVGMQLVGNGRSLVLLTASVNEIDGRYSAHLRLEETNTNFVSVPRSITLINIVRNAF